MLLIPNSCLASATHSWSMILKNDTHYKQSNTDSLFQADLPEQGWQTAARVIANTSWEAQNTYFFGSVDMQGLYKNFNHSRASHYQKTKLRELYYTNYGLSNVEFGVGKQIRKPSKSYSLTPLNIFDLYPYKTKDVADFNLSSQGESMVYTDLFLERSTLSFIVSKDLTKEDNHRSYIYRKTDFAKTTLIWEHFGGSVDITFLGSYNDEQKLAYGLGLSIVASDALELHMEALYRSSGEKIRFSPSTLEYQTQQENALFSVIGGQYTRGSFHFTLEHIYNSLNLGDDEWDELYQWGVDAQTQPYASVLPLVGANYANQLLTDSTIFFRINYNIAPDLMLDSNHFIEPYHGSALNQIYIKYTDNQFALKAGLTFSVGDRKSVYGNDLYQHVFTQLQYAF
jgi:hypothetical protein|tara:strand:- start:609 stop:1802 length:1194 start_codon:yes stop_codon:yes gene_type:complete